VHGFALQEHAVVSGAPSRATPRSSNIIKDGNTCAQLLKNATAAAQEGEGDGTEPTATAADQATASLDTSHYGEDATEGAAGGQSVGADESVSPTTTTAGRAGVLPAAVAGGASIGGEQLNAASPPRLYEGEKDAEGKRHGQGTLTGRDGAKYEGAWVHGEQHGKGTLTTSNGTTYTGEFVDGKFHGQGELTIGDEKWTGEFVRGVIVNGTHSKPSRTYTGEFGAGFKYHGEGVRETPGQSTVVTTVQLKGNWRNGFAVGLMHRTLPNGNTIKQCYFVDKVHNKRKPFDPVLQDHNGKYAWYSGMHGKLTALEDGQYTFACQTS
jgi:hypothetical protein